MTDLSAGIAYWDTTEVVSGGTFVGFHQVISDISPNILTASLNSNEFTFDTAVVSFFSMTWEASFMSSGGSGGGAPEVSPSFEDASSTIFISDTNGGQFFFNPNFNSNSEFVSGDAVYGDGFGAAVSGMSGQILMEGDSGTGPGRAFISGASGSEWEVGGGLIIGDGIFATEEFYSFSSGFVSAGGGSGVGTVSSGAIPEPSGISLLTLGALVIGLRRRR